MQPLQTWPEVLKTLLSRTDLTIDQAAWAMGEVMEGRASHAQLAGFLVALQAKQVSVGELVGFRDAILDAAVPLNANSLALDIVGTGGDSFRTVNISTTAAIVCAAAGVPVLKHGNRAASSASGASDVLGQLGVIPDDESPAQVSRVLENAGISFVWAARFHPGFRHAAEVRRELAIPTVFNFLGPLCNPARPEVSAVGVADRVMVEQISGVFATRGATAFVFRGEDGLDELTTTTHSTLWEISRGDIVEHDVDPRELGLAKATIADLEGGSPAENAATLRRTLEGETGPVRDIVLLNAAAGLAAWELHREPRQGDLTMKERLRTQMDRAAAVIDSGAASAKLSQWQKAANARVE